MIARYNREALRFLGDIPPEAEMKLIEAAQTGEITAWGQCDSTGETEDIPCIDWQECEASFRKSWLLERGRRVPRYTNVEFDEADIAREFASTHEVDRPKASEQNTEAERLPDNKQPARRGSPPKLNIDDLRCAFEIECGKHGCTPPDKDGAKGWKIQADVVRWILSFAEARGEAISESTAKAYALELTPDYVKRSEGQK
jgi:hypothetical protein